MADDADIAQETAERLASQLARPLLRSMADRICIRCGFSLPAEILVENPDALDCGGTCGRLG